MLIVFGPSFVGLEVGQWHDGIWVRILRYTVRFQQIGLDDIGLVIVKKYYKTGIIWTILDKVRQEIGGGGGNRMIPQSLVIIILAGD